MQKQLFKNIKTYKRTINSDVGTANVGTDVCKADKNLGDLDGFCDLGHLDYDDSDDDEVCNESVLESVDDDETYAGACDGFSTNQYRLLPLQ